jgi:TRAP-type mannitol/chloroaromatic compound transport system substrate-binding protein
MSHPLQITHAKESAMNRRTFMPYTAATAVAAGSVLVDAPAVHAQPKYAWKLVTVWPKGLPGLSTNPIYLAQIIEAMSDKRLTIQVYQAGELVKPLEVFDAVAAGTAEMGHATSLFWQAKHPAIPFFSNLPFGLNALETQAWMTFGGGQALQDKLYAPFNLKPFPVCDTGVQMGGWFNKEIRTIDDFQGLKMRIPSFGGQVLSHVGVQTITLPAGEVVPALQAGTIDAAEWVGPYMDLSMGFHKFVKYYYWPGWHEPCANIDLTVNRRAYEALPADLRAIIPYAAQAAYEYTTTEFTARNSGGLVELLTQHKVQIRRFSDRVLTTLGKISRDVVAETAARDPFAQKVYDSYNAFRKQAIGWSQIGEEGYSLARTLAFA